MKDFIKFTLASTFGIIISGCIFLLLGIVTITSIITITDTDTTIKPNSILMLDFQGTLHERVQENPLLDIMEEDYQAHGLDDILCSIKKSKTQPIHSRYLSTSRPNGSILSLFGRNPQCSERLQGEREIRCCIWRPILPRNILLGKYSRQDYRQSARKHFMAWFSLPTHLLQRIAEENRYRNANFQGRNL